MVAPGRVYISCATADANAWRSRILTAWAPLENSNIFELWYREKEADVGESIEYHAAVLLITANYLADKDALKREFSRFIKFKDKGRGLFWIPIESAMYNLPGIDLQNITPVWGFQGGEAPPSTVVGLLDERLYSAVWTSVGEKILDWWKKSGVKLDDKLEDTRVNNQIVIEPKPLIPSRSQFVVQDRAQLLRILPCLIDREPQERPLSKRLGSVQDANASKIVFVLPGPREERSDRFADRLDGYTIAAMRAKGTLQSNIEFCRAGWPGHAEGEAARSLFEEYLDAVFKSMRLVFNCDSSKAEDDYMKEAAALLKPRMRDTRFVFWTEIAANKPSQTAKELFAKVLAWWQRFVPRPGANGEFLSPIAVLAPTTSKVGLADFLPEAPNLDHVAVLTELSPIEHQDMVNWLTLSEVRGFDSAGNFRSKIEKLYPGGNERICFAALEKEIIKWLTA
jgi:hypothetical protein